MRDAHEVILRVDLDEDYVEAWAEDRGWIGRLTRAGFVETQRQGRGVWLRGAIRQIHIGKAVRRPSSTPTAASLAALANVNRTRRQGPEAA